MDGHGTCPSHADEPNPDQCRGMARPQLWACCAIVPDTSRARHGPITSPRWDGHEKEDSQRSIADMAQLPNKVLPEFVGPSSFTLFFSWF